MTDFSTIVSFGLPETQVDDLIEAIMRLAGLPPQDQKTPYRAINIGGGQPVVLSDFIAAIELALGKTAQHFIGEKKRDSHEPDAARKPKI